MRRFIAIAACLLAACWCEARTLAEAAESLATKLPEGCIVTGELTPQGVRFALAGRSPGQKQAPETLVFEIASLTKVFTGILLAQAVVDKKVSLDTRIGELLGSGFKFADPRVGRITLRQLSTHTSGLPRMPDNFADGFKSYATYDEAQMLGWLAKVELKGDATHDSSYSNVGVALLGCFVAKQYGKPWSDCVAEKICLPLGMTHTLPNDLPSPGTLAPPHSGAGPAIVTTFRAFAPAGGLRSTAADMIVFGKALAHPERTPLEKALKLALQPHADAKPKRGSIGLGAFLVGPPEHVAYVHDGATAGYRSAIQVIPSADIVRIVLMNNTTFEGSDVLKAMR